MKLNLKDNSIIDNQYINHPIISQLKNVNIAELYKNNFIVFPPLAKNSKDLLEENYIIETSRDIYRTANIVGIINQGNNEMHISSRFYNAKFSSDYFLRYLIEKTINYNVIDSQLSSDKMKSYYDLLIFLFPFYLNKAMVKGVYKEYVNNEYNNANLKGRININKHIINNIPFTGKISYQTREFNLDNTINQLIRHTIEKVSNKLNSFVIGDKITNENIRLIKESTPAFNKNDLSKILNYNILNSINHPYFTEYSDLQKLCIQILREDKVGFGKNKNNLYGIIIDISWLWEEYLAKLLDDYLEHPDNRKRSGGLDFYKNKRGIIYPDFYSKNNNLVLDAKYKHFKSSIQREDLYQLTSYLHVMKSKNAAFIYPSMEIDKLNYNGELNGYGGNIYKVPFNVPQKANSYAGFIDEIELSENQLKENIFYLIKK